MRNSIFILLVLLSITACKKDDPTPQDNTPTGPSLPEEFIAIAGLFDGNGIGAAVNLTEDIVLLFNVDGDKYAWLEDDEIKATYNVSDPDGHFGESMIQSIGAIGYLNGSTVFLFDLTGMTYTSATFDPGDADEGWINDELFTFATSTFSLTQWGVDNSCPFTSIGAIWNYSNPGFSCFGATENTTLTWMVDGLGTNYVLYSYPSSGTFVEEEELENWTAINNCNGPDGLIPFDAIGAACRLVRTNKIQELFFSEDGLQFSFYNVSEGEFSEVYDLY